MVIRVGRPCLIGWSCGESEVAAGQAWLPELFCGRNDSGRQLRGAVCGCRWFAGAGPREVKPDRTGVAGAVGRKNPMIGLRQSSWPHCRLCGRCTAGRVAVVVHDPR